MAFLASDHRILAIYEAHPRSESHSAQRRHPLERLFWKCTTQRRKSTYTNKKWPGQKSERMRRKGQ